MVQIRHEERNILELKPSDFKVESLLKSISNKDIHSFFINLLEVNNVSEENLKKLSEKLNQLERKPFKIVIAELSITQKLMNLGFEQCVPTLQEAFDYLDLLEMESALLEEE